MTSILVNNTDTKKKKTLQVYKTNNLMNNTDTKKTKTLQVYKTNKQVNISTKTGTPEGSMPFIPLLLPRAFNIFQVFQYFTIYRRYFLLKF